MVVSQSVNPLLPAGRGSLVAGENFRSAGSKLLAPAGKIYIFHLYQNATVHGLCLSMNLIDLYTVLVCSTSFSGPAGLFAPHTPEGDFRTPHSMRSGCVSRVRLDEGNAP